jgi:hypothetical protein
MSTHFETKVKPILKYVGTIGATLMSVAYIGIVLLLVFGFSTTASLTQSLLFAAVTAVMGLIIMQFLKVQGIDLAKELEDNKEILKEYYSTKTKDKKFRSIKHFWTSSLIKDIIMKGVTLASATLGTIYIVIIGTQNYAWLLLAAVNLIMFACFGLLALVKAYDFFNESHIPYIQERLNENKEEQRKKEEREAAEREETIQREVQRLVALAKEECIQQRNATVDNNSGNNLLDSSMGICSGCVIDSKSMVVDSDNKCDYILGGSVYTSDGITNPFSIFIEENLEKNKTTED